LHFHHHHHYDHIKNYHHKNYHDYRRTFSRLLLIEFYPRANNKTHKIELTLPEHAYILGNEIFSNLYLQWHFARYFPLSCFTIAVNDENYALEIIDDEMNIFILDQHSFLVIDPVSGKFFLQTKKQQQRKKKERK
jgi:hypothetical protein